MIEVHFIHEWKGHNEIHFKITRKIKRWSSGKQVRKSRRGDDYDQSILHACVEQSP
jgi:hypothetical protein